MIEETTVESYTPAAVILPYEVTGEYYVEELGELDADRDAGRARADDGDILSLRRLMLHDDFVEVDIRNIMLDARNLHRSTFASLNAVALALLLMVADE